MGNETDKETEKVPPAEKTKSNSKAVKAKTEEDKKKTKLKAEKAETEEDKEG